MMDGSSNTEATVPGEGEGADYHEAFANALADAWSRVRYKGNKHRVLVQWVSGDNPITWCRLELKDEGGR
jgi:hypothetical protein